MSVIDGPSTTACGAVRAPRRSTAAGPCGWSAAELLGASCGPRDAPVELIVPGGSAWNRERLVVLRYRLADDEITAVDGVACTTPARTAFDLGRRRPTVDAICAVDALLHVCGVRLDDIEAVARRHPGARGARQLAEVLQRSSSLAESPMESRIRVAIEDAGLPVPVLQHPLGPYRLDLAYPELKLAIEYDGREHLTVARAQRDLRRQAFVSEAGWQILRFTAAEVFHPALVAARVRAARARRLVECR